ncbi:MAG: hypothetical protein AB1546_01995 [bacterium]
MNNLDMAIRREEVKKWLVNYQHDLLTARYRDVDGGDVLINLFSDYIYPTYENRSEYHRRNEFFKKLADFYTAGRVRKILGGTIIFFSPILGITRQMRDLPEYLRMAVELYDLTCELDERMVDALCESAGTSDDLCAESYEAAYRKCATYEERERQIKHLIAVGEYARDIVERGGVLDFLVENCPRVPLFMRNRYVEGINEVITLLQTTYRAFKRCKNSLNRFRDICLEREYQYLDSMLKPVKSC